MKNTCYNKSDKKESPVLIRLNVGAVVNPIVKYCEYFLSLDISQLKHSALCL